MEKEITKAFVYSYQEQVDALFQNYLDHAEAYVNKTRVKDRNTREELQLDERGYIVVTGQQDTSVSNVFAVGDVSNPLAPTISGATGAGATAAKVIASRLISK